MTSQHAPTDKRLFLLDAYALIFRGYYTFIKNPRINSKGLNTSAIIGFCNTLMEILRKENPTHIAVVFDVGSPTVRTDFFPAYKAHRDETPEAIKLAVPYIHDVLEAFRIPIFFHQGYEADDVIGTLAKEAEKRGFTTYIMTPDKDFGQLVNDHTFMYRPATRGNGSEILGLAEIQEKFGVERPEQIIDLLAMMGDAVDNIPGLPGVGEKTAKKYIAEYGSLENLLAHAEDIKGKVGENIRNNKELGIMSKKLATIITDVPIAFDENALVMETPDIAKITELFQDLEFRRLLDQVLNHYGKNSQPVTTIIPGSQISLFGEEASELVTASIDSVSRHDAPLYQCLDSIKGRQLLLAKLLQQEIVSFCVKFEGNNPFESQIIGLSFSFKAHVAYYIPLHNKQDVVTVLKEFQSFFDHQSILKVGHDLKTDLKVLKIYGVELKTPLFDTMIAHYLINPDGQHGLESLASAYLKHRPVAVETLGNKYFSALEEQCYGASQEADLSLQLFQVFKDLFSPEIAKLFYELEMPLMCVLMQMELHGICLDTNLLTSLSIKLTHESEILEKELFALVGESFNLASPKQLGLILFEKLQLDPKAKKTKTGQYATSEETLTKLRDKHEIIDKILEYRQIQKLRSTYIDALPKEINAQTKRVHTTFRQTVAATGRLSANQPNLQNIPIRTVRGQEIRRAFIAQNDQYRLISADYSQIELRLIAEMAEEPAMIQSFINGEDIHASTASKLFDVAIDQVIRAQRSQAKTVNFGIIYGVSAFGLSEQTNLSRKEAKALIDAYYDNYPALRIFIQKQIEFARTHGYVETLLGRKRYLKDIHSANAMVRSHAERNAVNAPIQGSAADLIKLAMIAIQDYLNREGLQTKLLLQVHDELVLESPLEEKEMVKHMVKSLMENVIRTRVPLLTEVSEGTNWLEAH